MNFPPSIKAIFPTLFMGLIMCCIQLLSPLNFWIDWYVQPQTLGNYCEQQLLDAVFREPISSWSNLIYWYLGWWILFDPKSQHSTNFLYSNNGYIWYWGVLYLFMGTASWFFHASIASIALAFDMGGVYISFLLPFILNLHRILNYSSGNPAEKSTTLMCGLPLFAVTVGGTLGYLEDSFNSIPVVLFGLVLNVVMFVYIEMKWTTYANTRYLWIALILILCAAFSWCADKFRLVCDADGWIHGHAVWHVLMSVGAFQMYRYLKSEGTEANVQS